MTRRFFVTCALLFPLVTLAASSVEDAQHTLRTAIDEVLALADKAPNLTLLEQRIAPVLQKTISFDVMTRRAVGPGWRQFNDAQQKSAITFFTKLVIRSYCNKFTIGEHPEIKYSSATSPADGRVDVTTMTLYKGERFPVIYRMENAGAWRATDVVIEGVSMVANYRNQLDPVFKKGGADAVVRSLEQSVNRPK